jgi:hypothetical protein
MSVQVSIMEPIFGMATYVTVWLGPAADDSDELIDSLRDHYNFADADNTRLAKAMVALSQRDY